MALAFFSSRPRLALFLSVGATLGIAALQAVAAPKQQEAFRFTRGPYIQGLSSSSVIIRWETSVEEGGTLLVEGGAQPIKKDYSSIKTYFHTSEITGLTPNTPYKYTVSVGANKSEQGQFTTPPIETNTFSFLVYGDNRSDASAHAAVVEALKRSKGDFLINTGDMVATGGFDSDWDEFFQIETPLLRDRCVFACIGNHELVGQGASRFLRYFHPASKGEPHLYYSVRWGNARFFFVNAMASWGAGEEDYQWLKQELEKSSTEQGVTHRFVVMHHGPNSSGPHGGNRALAASNTNDLLRKHNVIVFAGHDHLYERGDLNGLRYILSGGGGAPIYKQKNQITPATQALEPVHHFISVSIEGANLTTVATRVDGSIIETCKTTPKEPWACEGNAAVKATPKAERPAATPSPDLPSSTPVKTSICQYTPSPISGNTALILGLVISALTVRVRRLKRQSRHHACLGSRTDSFLRAALPKRVAQRQSRSEFAAVLPRLG